MQLLEPLTQSQVSLDAAAPSSSAAVLVLFICNHCPFVLAVIDQLNVIAKEYSEQGVATIGVSSNSMESHPQGGLQWGYILSSQVTISPDQIAIAHILLELDCIVNGKGQWQGYSAMVTNPRV